MSLELKQKAKSVDRQLWGEVLLLTGLELLSRAISSRAPTGTVKVTHLGVLYTQGVAQIVVATRDTTHTHCPTQAA